MTTYILKNLNDLHNKFYYWVNFLV
jgi:hypothetical protein